MTVRLLPIASSSSGPIHLVIAGYRSRPAESMIQAAGLSGSIYAVHWAAGKWSEAGASVGVIARGMRVGLPALRTGQMLLGVGSLATGAGGAIAIGAGRFRHRYWCANRDGRRLPELLRSIPGITHRPVSLYGHSLGTVVIRSLLETVQDDRCRIEDVVLMGGMASRQGWQPLAERFRGRLINLYSPQDRLLSISPVWDRVVGTGEVAMSETSIGTITTSPERSFLSDRVVNHNLSRLLPSQFNALAHHCGYWKHFASYLARA